MYADITQYQRPSLGQPPHTPEWDPQTHESGSLRVRMVFSVPRRLFQALRVISGMLLGVWLLRFFLTPVYVTFGAASTQVWCREQALNLTLNPEILCSKSGQPKGTHP